MPLTARLQLSGIMPALALNHTGIQSLESPFPKGFSYVATAQSGAMNPNIDRRARLDAARCLRMAKSAQSPDDKHSWLALAESWLTTVQLYANPDCTLHLTEEQKAKALEWAAQ